MAIRDTLQRLFGAKASIIPLSTSEIADRPLEKTFDDATLLSTYRDDAWPYICTRILAENGSTPPLIFGRFIGKEREWRPVGPDHPVQQLFDNPNPMMTGREFRQHLWTYLSLAGHSPIELVKPGNGIIGAPGRTGRRARDGFELWPISPHGKHGSWRIVGNADRTIAGYVLLREGREDIKWRPDRMTYLRWVNPNDHWYGQSRIAAVRQSIMAEEYAAIRDKKFEKNLGVPPGILSSEMPLGDPLAKELQKRWEQAVGGYQNAGKIAILGSKTTYQPIQMSARDSQWTDQRKWRIQEFGGAFGIPVVILVGMKDATFANAGEAVDFLWEFTLQPGNDLIAEMVTHRLLPLITSEPLVARFDYSEVDALNENAGELVERAKGQADTGAFTVDEVRKTAGFPPHADANLGGRQLVPSTMSLQAGEEIIASAQMGIEGQAASIEATRNPRPDEPAPAGRRGETKAQDDDRDTLLSPIRAAYERDLASYFTAQRGAISPLFKAEPGDLTSPRYAVNPLVADSPLTKLTQTTESDATDPSVSSVSNVTGSDDDVAPDPADSLSAIRELLAEVIRILTAKRFRDRLLRISRGPIEASLTAGATGAARNLGIGVSFSIPASEAAVERVTSHLNRLGQGIENTTVSQVRDVLQGSLRDGVDNAETRRRLDELFDGYGDWRLDRISRTETTAAYGLGAAGQYRDAGITTGTISDGDKDEACAIANGATWTLEQYEDNPISHPNCSRVFVPDTSDFGQPKRAKRTRVERDEAGRIAALIEE